MPECNKTRALIASIASLCGAGAAQAAWELVPEVGLATEVDDNARISPENQPSSTRTSLDARLRIRTFGERGQAYIEPRIVADAYLDERDEDLANDDLFLLTRARREFPRAHFDFQSDYRRESVLRSEFDDPLEEEPTLGAEPVTAGAGTFGSFTEERERFDVGIGGGLEVSDRTDFGLDVNWTDVGYVGDRVTNRTPFTSSTLTATLGRLVNDRDTVSASIYTTAYSADRNDNESDTLGVEASFSRPLSQTLEIAVGAGIARTEYDLVDANGMRVSGIDNGFTFGLELNKRSEVTTWTFALTQAIRPSSLGFLGEREDLRVRMRRELNPRLALSLGVRAARLDESTSGGVDDDDNYVRGAVALEWTLTPRWLLRTGYDRVIEDFGDDVREAVSNSVFIGVRYQGLSRQ